VNSRYVHAIDDTRARDKLTSLARSSVLDAGRGWIRSTGPARHGSGRSSQPLRSYRVRPSIAHRTCAALSRTSTTFGGGVHSPPAAWRLRCGGELHCLSRFSGRARCTRVPSSRSPSIGCACASRSRLGKPRHSGQTQLGALKRRCLASGYRRWRANRGDIGFISEPRSPHVRAHELG